MEPHILDNRQKLILSWCKALTTACDSDLWGQPVEATEGYRRLAKTIREDAKSEHFNDDQQKILSKVSACLDLRARSLELPDIVDGITPDDLKNINKTLVRVLESEPNDFPVNVLAVEARVDAQSPRSLPDGDDRRFSDLEDEIQDQRGCGTLLPRPVPIAGKTSLTIHVNEIGLKDASTYIDAFVTVSVKDVGGVDVTASQDTPFAVKREDKTVVFGVDVHIQRPLEYLPQGFAVFFEFKHYKPKKKSVSTKCWALIEKDELKEGRVALELYKKPTDYRRKNIHLLTIKPLYLRLNLTLTT